MNLSGKMCMLLWTILASLSSRVLGFDTPVLEYNGPSHYDFGYQLGERFKSQIHARVQKHEKLQTLLLPYYETKEGKELYRKYLETHNATFPEYLQEIEGIAAGSERPFEVIFLLNIVEEYQDSIPTSFTPDFHRTHELRCSDIVVMGDSHRFVAHNEDSGIQDVNHSAIVVAQIGQEPKFIGFTYLGDLPSGAFAANANGIAFTLNFVEPSDIEIGGLGRGFISRDLLTAVNMTEAIAMATRPHQAAGHNYQLMDLHANRVYNVEAASFHRFVVYEYPSASRTSQLGSKSIQGVTYFHANQYQRLVIHQPPYQSSLHRLHRYAELSPPRTTEEALWVLGDQQDQLYPIYHDAKSHASGELSGWTLATVVFDLRHNVALGYEGNPRLEQVSWKWDLNTMQVYMAA